MKIKDVKTKFCAVKGIENQARRSLMYSELKSVVLEVIDLIKGDLSEDEREKVKDGVHRESGNVVQGVKHIMFLEVKCSN